MINHPNIPKPNPNANVHSIDGLNSMYKNVKVMIVDDNACNDVGYTALNVSFFSNLEVFEVGDYSFAFVDEVKLIGLNRLERVIIGKHCFRRNLEKNPNRHFYLKNCERLRELKIGHHSFSDYSVCEIENVDYLEVIEMGEVNEWSGIFNYASLELKSDYERVK